MFGNSLRAAMRRIVPPDEGMEAFDYKMIGKQHNSPTLLSKRGAITSGSFDTAISMVCRIHSKELSPRHVEVRNKRTGAYAEKSFLGHNRETDTKEGTLKDHHLDTNPVVYGGLGSIHSAPTSGQQPCTYKDAGPARPKDTRPFLERLDAFELAVGAKGPEVKTYEEEPSNDR